MSDLDQVEWVYPLIIVQYDDPTSIEREGVDYVIGKLADGLVDSSWPRR